MERHAVFDWTIYPRGFEGEMITFKIMDDLTCFDITIESEVAGIADAEIHCIPFKEIEKFVDAVRAMRKNEAIK